MVLNPKIKIQNITSISESKSMSKISSSTSKSQTSYSTLRPQHSGRHRSVHSLSTSSRSWIKPQRLPFHTGHQVTQRRQSENCLNAQPLKTPTSNSFWMHPKRTDCGKCWTRVEICQMFYTTRFSGQKFYTVKTRILQLFLLTIKQRRCHYQLVLSFFLLKLK